jgi:glutaminyl-peptide cyclotransferase
MCNSRFRVEQQASQLNGRARSIALLILLSFLALGWMACRGDSTVNSNTTDVNTNAGNTAPPASPSPATQQAGAFDGSRAFEHVRKQVEIGPRPAGSTELAQARQYIIGELKADGLNVSTDEWRATTPVGERQMVNVTAELPGDSTDVIIISSHYDTKLFKQFRFVGANDGGASTGALLELARVMAASQSKPRLTYRFVFFDGEEAFCEEWDQCHNPDGPDNTYGSRRYVAQLKAKNEVKRVRAMILMDMMGYKELRLGRDDEMSSRWLVDTLWQTARASGHGDVFVDELEGVGGDDHEPFLKADIDAVDIIQLSSYPYWHTAEDTLDKISPGSLKVVGDVLLAGLPRIEERLLNKAPATASPAPVNQKPAPADEKPAPVDEKQRQKK